MNDLQKQLRTIYANLTTKETWTRPEIHDIRESLSLLDEYVCEIERDLDSRISAADASD